LTWRGDLAVLRHREVRVFLTARFVSLLGSAVGPIALAFAVLDLSGSASALGLVLAAQSVPMVSLMLVGADETFGRTGWGLTNAAFGLGLLGGGFLVLRLKPRYPVRFGLLGIFLLVLALLRSH
jgi:hypothetical protein